MLRNSYWSTKQSINPAINQSYTEMFMKQSGIDHIINEKVQKIKSKYGTQISFKDSFKDNFKVNFKNVPQTQSMYMDNQSMNNDNSNSNKENIRNQANRQNNVKDKKQTKNQNKSKIKASGIGKSHKIRQLQQINMKISKMIQNLKLQQQSQQIQHPIMAYNNSRGHITQSQIIPLSLHQQTSQSRLNITKLSGISVANSQDSAIKNSHIEDRNDRNNNRNTRGLRVKSQQSFHQYDVDRSMGNIQISYRNIERNKSYRNYSLMSKNANNSSNRQIGKIGRSTSARKIAKQTPNNSSNILRQNQQHELGKVLGRQVQYDQKYQNYKTKLTRITNKFKQIITEAIKNTIFSQHEKQLLLQWNFEDKDPLFTQRNWQKLDKDEDDENTIAYKIIDCFIKAQDNWRRTIIRKFSKNISLNELDEGKGYFLKEDLTRFVNLQCKQMYCNRDINTIFRRINKKGNKIVSTTDLLAIICN